MSQCPSNTNVQTAGLRPHRLAAMSVLTKAKLHDGLIPLRRALFVVLYDEDAGWSPQRTRLAGYRARRIPWGVRCGGAQDCQFDKNANLRPKPRAVGWRMDSRNRTVLRTARQLRKEIASRQSESDGTISTPIQLPEFWAAFRPCDVDRIDGDGPELLGEVHTTGQSAAELMQARRRDHNGLTLFPLAWTSHLWELLLPQPKKGDHFDPCDSDSQRGAGCGARCRPRPRNAAAASASVPVETIAVFLEKPRCRRTCRLAWRC